MSFSAAAKNDALDGWNITRVSLHSGWPGTTGANEISGGAYARGTVSVGAAVGGVRTASSVTLFVPASTIKWMGWWDGSTFLFPTPNGGATPKNFVALASDDNIYSPSHGYANTNEIVFWGGTAPGGLSSGTIYYVRDASTDSFKVAATPSGTAIDITSSASSGCWVSTITSVTYAVASTHAITVGTFLVPD
jgi:hypothetical protein